MKKNYKLKKISLLALWCSLFTWSANLHATENDTLFVTKTDGSVWAFPTQYILQQNNTTEALRITIVGDTTYIFKQQDIATINNTYPANRPTLTTFKFLKKDNDQLHNDVTAVINNPTISADVGIIGKYLTPAFQTSSPNAKVYVNGIEQVSNTSRHKFDKKITYTIAHPNTYILKAIPSINTTNNTQYHYAMQPLGTEYTTNINWLTAQANNIPRIDINVNGGKIITDKKTYLRAAILLDGKNIYPSLNDSVNIRGRGNTSWHNPQVYERNGQQVVISNPKNPYRLKFDKKRSPFGLKGGKNWVLLANKQRGSLMSNAIGMKIAAMVGTAAVNHIIPVDLYLNGEYRGNYNLTQQVGVSANSIDIPDEMECALLELDTYFDETFRFRSKNYDLPVNIKFPEFGDDETNLTQEIIETDFNHFVSKIKAGHPIEDIVDIEYLAKYLFVNDLILNYEIIHPKSTYLHRTSYSNGKYIFGPIWDLDWAWGYEITSDYAPTDFMYCTAGAENDFYTSMPFEAINFIRDLRKASTELDKAYYRVCKNFKEKQLQEVLDYCDDYYALTKKSFEQNSTKWGDGRQYEAVKENTKNWIKRRANFIYNNITHYQEEPSITNSVVLAKTKESSLVNVYNLQGILIKRQVPITDFRQGLKPGLYIVNGKKVMVK